MSVTSGDVYLEGWQVALWSSSAKTFVTRRQHGRDVDLQNDDAYHA